MDTGEGRFEEIDRNESLLREKYPRSGGIFEVGEAVEIKGSTFVVRKITKKDIVLRLKSRVVSL